VIHNPFRRISEHRLLVCSRNRPNSCRRTFGRKESYKRHPISAVEVQSSRPRRLPDPVQLSGKTRLDQFFCLPARRAGPIYTAISSFPVILRDRISEPCKKTCNAVFLQRVNYVSNWVSYKWASPSCINP